MSLQNKVPGTCQLFSSIIIIVIVFITKSLFLPGVVPLSVTALFLSHSTTVVAAEQSITSFSRK